ncbi:uncharacterized protein [Rutidosis leptorrhynchoides]|uniref:uncharacterized protein n=1 Tax=Rutidosis leptorrhynchoides TaxID=125765 RepID=UPI003A99E911
MYGGSGKLGRGRGSGPPVKRNIHSTFQPSSVQRPSATPPGGRLSAGSGHRSRSNTLAAPATVPKTDESFSLVRNTPLNFGMIIRLSPVLVEEIKRIEALGGTARIKFDSCANNPAGNVIDVGGKEFRFTWSQETGDLCDIYEERRSGDNGEGLLVEFGGAWRRINVQRELDDSVKNHVKMRTVEAERKHKSRKAIILDHGNPSMKNQMKALAAAEANNTWKGSYNKKKEPPFKKMKAEPSSAIIPPKSGGKAGFSSSTPSKIMASVSPLLSTPEQSGAPSSPLRNSNIAKLQSNRKDATLTQYASTSDKEMFNSVPADLVQTRLESNERFRNKPTDLQSLLISLLKEKPHGMHFKALEKAVGDTIPKSVKQIQPILEKIAVFQAPGKYILKPDAELESSKKTSFESGSFLDNNNHHREAAAFESSFSLKNDIAKEFEEPGRLISEPYEELNTSEKIDIDYLSPDVLNDKKVPHNSEGPAISSSRSGSGSDSDSDSSDSGSESRSRESSSDSESDASANSKQGSDEEVDIMSDDDIHPGQKLLPSDPQVGYARNMVDENDGHRSVMVETEKDLFDNPQAEMNVTTNLYPDNYADDTTDLYNHHVDHQESEFHVTNTVSRNNFKRGSDVKQFNENEHAKRLKSGNQPQPIISKERNFYSDSPISDWPNEDPYKGINNQMIGRTVGDVSDYEYDKVDNTEFIGKSTSDSGRSGLGPRSFDLNAHAQVSASMDYERGPQENDVYFMQKDKANKQIRDKDGHSKDKRPPKNSGVKLSGSQQKKHDSSSGKSKDSGFLSTSQIKDSLFELKNSPVINGRGPTLQREVSDLEMGELREILPEEGKKRFEKNNSFKQSDNNKSSSDYWNLDESKGKVTGRTSVDSVKASPFQLGIGMSGTHQIVPNKAVPEDHADDYTRVNGKPISRIDHAKAESQHSKGFGSVGYIDSQRKGPVLVPHKHEKQVVSITTKDKKKHMPKDLGAKKKPVNKKREMESCSDESISSYAKYEKEEPEMKGPIRDISQYKEYVQEYREKYNSYETLNKLLESYRNKFQTFASDLELAKGRDNDRYNKIVDQLMESYRQCGMKHKRLKKIFIVLHHEVKHLKEMIKDFANKQMKG